MTSEKTLKWTLSFSDEKMEKKFNASKTKFQKLASQFIMSAGSICCLLAWTINPFDLPLYEGVVLGYMITLMILITALFVYLRKAKSQSSLEFTLIALILYFILGALESIKENSADRKGKLYFFCVANILEFVLVALILARVGWIKNLFCFLVVISLTIYRYTPFEENFSSKFFPLLMQVENFLVLGLVAYKFERGEREHFYEAKSFEDSLSCFNNLITSFIPIPIAILDKGKMIFCNKETERMFDLKSPEAIYESLIGMKICSYTLEGSRDGGNADSDLREDALKQENSGIQGLGSTFMSLYQYAQESINKNGKVSIKALACFEKKEEDCKKFYEVQYKDVLWERNISIMIILEENKAIGKLNQLKEQAEYRNSVLAAISHGLRTPLYGITGMIDMCNEINQNSQVKHK